VVCQSPLRREESAAMLAGPFAHFSVLRDLMAESIVLSRELLGAAESARKTGRPFGLMGVHVRFECVLGFEATAAVGVIACKRFFGNC
jgi:hypothetical protein